MQTENKNTTAMIIASQNQDYVDEGLAEYQDQIHKLQSKSCIGYKYLKPACLVPRKINMQMPGLPLSNFPAYFKSDVLIGNSYGTIKLRRGAHLV